MRGAEARAAEAESPPQYGNWRRVRQQGERSAPPRQQTDAVARSPAVARESAMPIYQLDGQGPDLPDAGQYWIADTAVVIGRVRLGREVSVWFGSVLRGDNEWVEVGARSNIQENCTMHTDMGFPLTVGPECTIGHNVILHGCTIGAHSLIGMGATLLNGVKIGSYCIVGAGALVTEGKVFPDRSLIVGAPARALRTLDEAAIELIDWSADYYVKNWRRYAGGLKRVSATV
jgi:carbonic anhydrase/acetyltransferase-like protein (isoleucine patch superfamily)